MNQELALSAQVSSIDYLCVVDRFLPMVREKLLSMGKITALLRPVIQNASAGRICSLLDRILGTRKNLFLVSLVNNHQQELIRAIEDSARKQNIRLKIHTVCVQE